MRIAILGGTFDPVHQGHLFLAREAKRLLQLDQVWFMVANTSPLKQDQKTAAGCHRFAMTALAIRRDTDLLVSDLELGRKGPSYTIDTMDQLARIHPNHQFCFLAGGDSLQEIHSWKDYDRLLQEHCCAFVPRSGVELDWRSLDLPHLKNRLRGPSESVPPRLEKGCSYLLPMNPPRVSSTTIRDLLRFNRAPSVRQLPRSVYRHIKKHRLYEQKQTQSRQGL